MASLRLMARASVLLVLLLSQQAVTVSLQQSQPYLSQRPGTHYTLQSGWLNDAMGLYDGAQGLYHIFTDCDPDGTSPPWQPNSTKAWCHASSSDLMSWKGQPVLSDITFGTGNVLKDKASSSSFAHLMASGGFGFTTTDTDLNSWKPLGNGSSLVPKPSPSQSNATMIGDVFMFQIPGDSNVSLLVSSSVNITGQGQLPAALLYTSADKVSWSFVSQLYVGSAEDGPRMECGNLFPLGESGLWALIASSPDAGSSYWMVGSLVNNATFTPKTAGVVDFGSAYAAGTFSDDDDRRLLFIWLKDGLNAQQQKQRGWAGAMSLPRKVVLNSDQTLSFPPAEEVAASYGEPLHIDNLLVDNGTYELSLAGMNRQFHLSFEVSSDASVLQGQPLLGFEFLATADGAEQTRLTVDLSNTSSCLAQTKLQNDTAITGLSFANLRVSDTSACLQACCQSFVCSGFTFSASSAGDDQSGPTCTLFSVVNGTQSSTGMISASVTLQQQPSVLLDGSHSSLDPNVTRPVMRLPVKSTSSTQKQCSPGNQAAKSNNACPSSFAAGDMPGNDLQHFIPSVNSSNECIKACCSTAGCVAWTFAGLNPNDGAPCKLNQPCCWLKTAAINPVPKPTLFSGALRETKLSIMVDIFVDNTIIEVFVNDGAAVASTNVYPTRNDTTVLRLLSQNISTTFDGTIYPMKSTVVH